MSKKSKDEELDFIYLNENKRITSDKQKKKTTMNKRKKNNPKKINNNVGLADNEIIIGVNTKPINKAKNNINKKNSKSKRKKISTPKKNKSNSQQKNNTKNKDKTNKVKGPDKPKKKRSKVILLTKLIIPIILFGVIIAFLITSPVFNISEVEVIGNNMITSDTYLSLSKITIGNNIFNLSKKEIIQNIKENPYVDTVEVKRRLPSKIEITVKERKPSYMLATLNSYAYINNQGYILEINEQRLDVPIITGYYTDQEIITPGNRLSLDDLSKLEMVIKIMDTISISGITEIVSEIDITDKNNYTLIFLEENKIVYLGDGSNLTDRINIYLKAILQNEKGKSGEIFINGDLNQDKVFFREKV